jgi:hypothetical protein
MLILHWRYFLTLCDDLERTTRFVELAIDNYKTYSVEYARLSLAVGSEIDVVAKLLCAKINSVSTADNIRQYASIVLGKYPALPDVEVVSDRYGVSVVPWKDWSASHSPFWWKAYNNVKHKRHLCYKEANLENSLNALAGLMVLLGYLYSDELATHTLRPLPEVLNFKREYYIGAAMKADLAYLLPGATHPQAR